jgi:hypothetical protein
MNNLEVASSGVKVQFEDVKIDSSVFDHMQFVVDSIKPISSIVELVK